MENSYALLATFAQSAAAIVAIIGGFLVSRLVAISSERENIKRQLKEAKINSKLLAKEWKSVHEYRLENSISTFEGWLQEALLDEWAELKDLTPEELALGRIPRGSSIEEMTPYAAALHDKVATAFSNIGDQLQDGDNKALSLEKLKKRGLKINKEDEDLYESVFDSVVGMLPDAYTELASGIRTQDLVANLRVANIKPAWQHETEMRRLDESIQDELSLRSQLDATEQAVKRLRHDLLVFAQPVGVRAAIGILAVFSVLGIVAPLAVMTFVPTPINGYVIKGLFVSFVLGLTAVLGYIAWYFSKIKR